MRDFYRPARRKLRPTDVTAVLQGVLELAGQQWQQGHVNVECEWARDLPLLPANPDDLQQVFLNA
jgi:signal transduction histidine kinase